MTEMEFRLGGKSITVSAEENETILDCALRHALSAPYSCLEGMCTSCKAHIVSGAFEVPAQLYPDHDEGKKGWVLTCQSRIATACQKIVVDYDAANS